MHALTEYTQSLYYILACLASVVSISVAPLAWKRRHASGSIALALLLVGTFIWSAASALEVAFPKMGQTLIFTKIEYFSIPYVPVLWFIVICNYLGRTRYLTKRNTAFFFVIPVITTILVWTNSYHHLIYTRVWLDRSFGVPSLAVDYGWGFYTFYTYTCLISLSAFALVLHAFFTSSSFYRKQLSILILSALIPFTTDIVYVLRVLPCHHLDATPIAFTITGILIVFGMARYHLWDITPVAHRMIVDGMRDGILVLDAHHRILEVNPSACRIIGKSPTELIGHPLEKVTYYWEVLMEMLQEDGEEVVRQITLERPKHRDYEVRMTSLQQHVNGDSERLIIIHDETERRRLEARMHEMAFFDMLTGLPNRALFLDRLERVLISAKRRESITAVIFLDLDRFKEINDTLGHSVGDELLKQVAGRLTTCIRESDTVARLGGDEFVIILTDILHISDIDKTADRMIDAFSSPFLLEENSYEIHGSMGISISPQDGDTVQDLMKYSDIAMYSAKRSGGNSYRFYKDFLAQSNSKTLNPLSK